MKRVKWVIFVVAILIFSLLAYFVLEGKTGEFDSFIYKIVTFNKTDFISGFYKFITNFASGIMVGIISLVFLIIFKNKRYGGFIFLNVFNIFVLNFLLKLLFMRDRPYELMIIDEVGYSFPSGHAMAALGFYGFIIYLLWHFNLAKSAKIIFSVLLGALIILIGVSRIYLGVHYASDVLAGYMVSLAYLILYITCVKKCLKFGDLNGDS